MTSIKLKSFVFFIFASLISCSTVTNTGDKSNNILTSSEIVNNKETFIRFLECAITNAPDTAKVPLKEALNAAKISPIDFPKASMDDAVKLYGQYCSNLSKITDSVDNKPSVIPSIVPSPLDSNSSNINFPGLSENAEANLAYIKSYLNCSLEKIASSKNTNDILQKISISSYLNALRFVSLNDMTKAKAQIMLESYYKNYKIDDCLNLPSTTKTPQPIVNVANTLSDGVSAENCEQESNLKSGTGASINISFVNNATKKINIYWLDFNGKRVSYKKGLETGNTHKQQTFVTHPWLITDENDNCIKIYKTSLASNNTSIAIDSF